MARKSRFSKSSSMPVVAAIVVFGLGAFVQLWLARPFALGGLLIDRELRVAAGSTLPPLACRRASHPPAGRP